MPRPLEHIAISETELAPFLSGNDPASRAHALLQQQKGAWEMLRTGYNTLQSVRTKVHDFGGFQIKVQFNPGRLISTSAKMDAASIKERQCFLCPDNLPPAQRGIPCDGDYLVLCNPFPIFPEHFTISSLRHTPQLIRDSFRALVRLTQELGARYMVLYNGPRCGASAPDHLHFQAGNRSFVPIDGEYEALKQAHATRLFESGSLRAYSIEQCLRRFITFESNDAGLLQRAFGALYDAFQEPSLPNLNLNLNRFMVGEHGVSTQGPSQEGGPAGEEPMLNILASYTNGEWRIHFFPRAKHRPSFYFKEGEDKLLISPAAVELGGICTTPRQQDFDKVTREHLVEIYNEICLSEERFAAIKARLAPSLAALAGETLS